MELCFKSIFYDNSLAKPKADPPAGLEGSEKHSFPAMDLFIQQLRDTYGTENVKQTGNTVHLEANGAGQSIVLRYNGKGGWSFGGVSQALQSSLVLAVSLQKDGNYQVCIADPSCVQEGSWSISPAAQKCYDENGCVKKMVELICTSINGGEKNE